MSTSSMKDMRRIFAEWPVSIPKAGLVVDGDGLERRNGDTIATRNATFLDWQAQIEALQNP